MKFEDEVNGKCVVVRPCVPRLDSIVAPEFRQCVVDLSQKHKLLVVVDLINVEFMDSSGLGAAIGCYKVVQENGGLAFCNMHKNVKEVFTLTHMDRIIEIHDDYDACLNKLAA